MSDDQQQDPLFKRKRQLNEPRIVGAQWWQEQLQKPVSATSRRTLLTWALGGAGVLLVGGPILSALTKSRPELHTKDALAAQQAHGWSLGSEGEVVEFASATGGPFPAERLASLAKDLAPVQPRLTPYYVPTLFQSTTGAPPLPTGSQERSLSDILRPIQSPEMAAARGRGEALATLFTGAPPGKAVIIDLPGPEAVAFATGLASELEPVFLFDNWPHPHGVVPSHLTLAAAASLAGPLRDWSKERKSGAPPAFVLDRARLTPYVDDAGQFDNRYLARLPTAAALKSMGIGEILYVAPTAETKESDDLVDDFVAFSEAGLLVKTVAASDFRPDPTPEPEPKPVGHFRGTGPVSSGDPLPDAGPQAQQVVTNTVHTTHYYYGGSRLYHYGFWSLYSWGTPSYAYREPINVSQGHTYRPSNRATMFSTGVIGQRSRPSSFGKVATVVESGRVVGAHFGRSGSFGRGTWTGS
jgi:hypothetical protein